MIPQNKEKIMLLFSSTLYTLLYIYSSKVKELKELSLPMVAEELRQQSFWRSFISSKAYVLTP